MVAIETYESVNRLSVVLLWINLRIKVMFPGKKVDEKIAGKNLFTKHMVQSILLSKVRCCFLILLIKD